MNIRIDYRKIAPEAVKVMYDLENYVRRCGLEESLLQLIKYRASQINGCAYCMDMHTKDARANGETEQRLYCLSAWYDSPFYTGRECAALAWTEAVTMVSEVDISNELYEEVRHHFTEIELVNLTMAIIAINSWNRLAISFGREVGSYHPEGENKTETDENNTGPRKRF
jgi:AhpD family alkylhydroperoxidase